MCWRTMLFCAVFLIAMPLQSWGQGQPNQGKKRPRTIENLPQFRLPGQAGKTPLGRSAAGQQQTGPSQQPKSTAKQLKPEDILKLLPGVIPQPVPYEFDDVGPQPDPIRTRRVVPPPPRRPVPSDDQIALLSEQQRHKLLQSAVLSLEEELSRINTGSAWRKYLNTRLLLRMFAEESPDEDDAESRALLQAIADNYDEVQRQSEYRAVFQEWGFQTLRQILRYYAADPLQRSKQLVRSKVEGLAGSLDRLRGASGWKDYLQLSDISRYGESDELSDADRHRLTELVKRFAEVGDNPDYRKITSLADFDATRRALEQLIASLPQTGPSQTSDRADHVEQLVLAVLKNLRTARETCREESKAQLAMATVKLGSPEADKAQSILEAIRKQHDAEMNEAEEQLKAVLAAIKAGQANDSTGAAGTLKLEPQPPVLLNRKEAARNGATGTLKLEPQPEQSGTGS